MSPDKNPKNHTAPLTLKEWITFGFHVSRNLLDERRHEWITAVHAQALEYLDKKLQAEDPHDRWLPASAYLNNFRPDATHLKGGQAKPWEAIACYAYGQIRDCSDAYKKSQGTESPELWSTTMDAIAALTDAGSRYHEDLKGTRAGKPGAYARAGKIKARRQVALEMLRGRQFKTKQAAANYLCDMLPKTDGGTEFFAIKTILGWLNEEGWKAPGWPEDHVF